MAVKYLCCDCDFDMTDAVKQACSQGPDVRAAVVQFKGMKLAHAAATVFLTCPNGHTCEFPCVGSGHGL